MFGVERVWDYHVEFRNWWLVMKRAYNLLAKAAVTSGHLVLASAIEMS